MKRVTHITTGAAIVLPVAIGSSLLTAGGVLFLGMAGAVVPDYVDLHSDLRRFLRHRGFSHSVFFAMLAIGLVYMILRALTEIDDPRFRLHPGSMMPLMMAFILGMTSHLLLDAATPSGIRPLLPFSQFRLHILPAGLRIPTGGMRDESIHLVTSILVMLGMLYFIYERV